MKNIFLLIPILLIAITSSCKKEPANPTIQSYPDSLFVKINGKELSAAPLGGPNAQFNSADKNLFAISIARYDSGYHITHWLTISNLHLAKANQTVYCYNPGTYDGRSIATFSLMDTIVVGNKILVQNSYSVLNSDSTNNQFIIDSYDAGQQIIKGRFHFTMYRSDTSQAPTLYGFADTLKFTDCYFNMRIRNN